MTILPRVTSEQGDLHCGPNSVGHFVKMVHNDIEYGMMAAHTEGLGILRGANIGKQQGESNAETTLLRDTEFHQFKAAMDEGVPAPVLTTTLYARFSSRGDADFQDRLLSAMRYGFGGHWEASAK